jgi:hypothetical protein
MDHKRTKKTELVKITPDITVKTRPKKGLKAAIKDAMKQSVTGPEVGIAFELENDYHWDFQESLRQLKKYREIRRYKNNIISRDLHPHTGMRVSECIFEGQKSEK